MLSDATSIGYLLATTFIWSSYLAMRKKLSPDIGAVYFTVIYCASHFLFSLSWWLSAGTGELYDTSASIEKGTLVMFGGVFVILAEFLYFLAGPHLRYSLFMGFGLSSYFISTPWTYFVDSDGISAPFLFGALGLMACGLGCLVYSQYLSEESDKKFAYERISNEDEETVTELAGSRLSPPASPTSSDTSTDKKKSSSYWVGVVIVAAILVSMWSILPTYAYTGTDALTDPSLVFLLYTSGYLIALPLIIFVFHNFIHIADTPVPNLFEIITAFPSLPADQVFYAVITGLYSAAGYFFYFLVVMDSSMPTAVAVEFLMCQAPLAIVISGMTSDEKHIEWSPIGMVLVAFVFYSSAAILLFMYSY